MKNERILLIILLTFFISYIITPLAKKIAVHINCVDVPNKRRINKVVMPTLGGLAIYTTFILGSLIFLRENQNLLAIILSGTIILILGMIDGINPIKARYKLIGQIFAAFILVYFGDMVIDNINFFDVTIKLGLLSYPLTILFILGMINAINLIDGLDGLATGISSIYFLTTGIIALLLQKHDIVTLTISFIMLGSSLGFLMHNFYPATIFLGDSGSMFLGLMMSVIAINGFKSVTFVSLIVPLMIIGIPIFDTACAIVRRIVNKKPIGEPDKEHLHHQFLKKNIGHKNTVLIIYSVNILFALSSIIYVLQDKNLGILIHVLISVILIWIIAETDIIIRKRRDKNEI